ncbi:hypothetical protein GGR52DRAFT_408403 [Hypoxylon sp. FL1284]|nr:hypothetical protein GGR52DRAFT_408403 [Hypoxylon sp. FL1284]
MGNPTEATISQSASNAEAPPPYSATEGTSAAAPSYEATAPPDGSSIAGISGGIPQTLNAYFPKSKALKTLHLGSHADAPRLAVTVRGGASLWAGPRFELHAGPGEDSPVAATVGGDGEGRKSFDVRIVAPAREDGWQQQTVTVRQEHDWKTACFRFSADVGLGKDVRREDFEWRHSRGEEVGVLNKHGGVGWKLVRLGSEAAGQGSERATRSAGATSDGREVVAVWAHNSSWSANKAFKFQFLESGAAGVLGEPFALVALASALKMWHAEYLQAASTAVVAGVVA